MTGETNGNGNDKLIKAMMQMMQSQREQSEAHLQAQREQSEAQLKVLREQMDKQNETIQTLLTERPERSDTRSEVSEGLRHRGPSIDALEEQIRNFSYNPEDGVTFDSWFECHREIFENDLSDIAEGDKVRLLLRHVVDKVYKQFVDHIRPKKPSAIEFSEILTIMQDLFGDKKSVFEKRLDVFGLKRLKCNDIKEFSGFVNRVVEEVNIKDMSLEQFKAVVMLAGIDLPRYTATMFHVMSDVKSTENPTIESILSVVNLYREVYNDSHAVSKQNDPQVNAITGDRNQRKFGGYKNYSSNVPTQNKNICGRCGREHKWKEDECGWSKGMKCYNCNEFGHFSVKCTKPQKRLLKRENKVNAVFGDLPEDLDKFETDAIMNGKVVRMTVDTGSDLTLISDSTWMEIGAPKRSEQDAFPRCANGKKHFSAPFLGALKRHCRNSHPTHYNIALLV